MKKFIALSYILYFLTAPGAVYAQSLPPVPVNDSDPCTLLLNHFARQDKLVFEDEFDPLAREIEALDISENASLEGLSTPKKDLVQWAMRDLFNPTQEREVLEQSSTLPVLFRDFLRSQKYSRAQTRELLERLIPGSSANLAIEDYLTLIHDFKQFLREKLTAVPRNSSSELIPFYKNIHKHYQLDPSQYRTVVELVQSPEYDNHLDLSILRYLFYEASAQENFLVAGQRGFLSHQWESLDENLQNGIRVVGFSAGAVGVTYLLSLLRYLLQ